jgi:ankyrin repeat protein
MDDHEVYRGWTALMIASRYNNNPAIVQRLLSLGANINKEDRNGTVRPLQVAIKYAKNVEVIKYLIDAEKETHLQDDKYWFDLLCYASANSSSNATIKYLTNIFGDVNYKDKINDVLPMHIAGYTPLHYAVRFSNLNSLIALIEAGANVNARANDGLTVLMLASMYAEDPIIIETLVKYGANINDIDTKGKTALMYAAFYFSDQEIISTLVNLGANINQKDQTGYTALMYAVINHYKPNSLSLIITLLNLGSHINDQTNSGYTALMLAAKNNESPNIILYLLESGASGKLKNKDGNTAFDLVKGNNHLVGTDAYWALYNAKY